MLPVVTRTLAEHKTKEESVRKDKERAAICGHYMQNHFLFVGCLAFASPLHLLSLSFAPKQVKLIHIIQIDIPEVCLTWFYTVTIKCSFNF